MMKDHKQWLAPSTMVLIVLSSMLLWATLAFGTSVLPDVPDKMSPLDNLALNPVRSGYPHPLESDDGWGGGKDKWDIVDGMRIYPHWANGLAFTGGWGHWAGPPGWRQATINFGELKTFNRVIVWHHHALAHYDDVPNTYKIQYWDDTDSVWVDIFSTTNGRDYLRYPMTDSADGWWDWNTSPTENVFPPVTSSKVRFALDNRDNMAHGWVYNFEVYIPEPATVFLLGFGGLVVLRRQRSLNCKAKSAKP